MVVTSYRKAYTVLICKEMEKLKLQEILQKNPDMKRTRTKASKFFLYPSIEQVHHLLKLIELF